MAVIYCRSTDGSDSDNGSTWALAKATLQAAITAAGSGGTVYVSQSHSETFSTTHTLTLGSSAANAVKIIAVDDSSGEPPTTLVDKDSASNPSYSLTGGSYYVTLSGCAYIYGVEFASDTGTTNSYIAFANNANTQVTFERCYINMSASGGAGGVVNFFGATNDSYEKHAHFIDCDFTFGQVNGFLMEGKGALSIDGGSILSLGTSVNIFRFAGNGDTQATVRLNNFDMSNVTADDNIFSVANYKQVDVIGRRLKFSASYASIVDDPTKLQPVSTSNIKIHSYGTGDEYYQFYEASYYGEIEESTAVYRSGGATYDGTNEFSAKLIANANTNYQFPLRFKLSELKLDLTSSTTLTVHTAQNAGTTYQDDEFWIEVEYPDSTDLALSL